LDVVCTECARIYVNGELADGGATVEFVSDGPRELFLVAGDLVETRTTDVRFIGAPLSRDTAAAFAATIVEVSAFLAAYTGVPDGPLPDVLTIAPARAPRRGNLWGFFADPALALIGMSVPEILTAIEREGTPARRQVLGFV